MNQPTVTKPVNRGPFRKKLGKEYFIVKRQMKWMANSSKFARVNHSALFKNSIIKHQSFLLRPLKDVDMVLQHNKVKNLEIAIGHINGVVINPGETFSIWQMVGRPTKGKGYLEGLVLENGRISKGTGGGLCQLGNLLYWMALHTPLTITERWRHSYDVFPDINRSIPFACGATLSYNYVDFQITNTTNSGFQIKLWLDKAYLNGEIVSDEPCEEGFEVFETDHKITQQFWGGYTRHNKIWKKRTNKITGESFEELVTENHAIMMYSPLLGE
jgi:vancomycin resistance protein VanW